LDHPNTKEESENFLNDDNEINNEEVVPTRRVQPGRHKKGINPSRQVNYGHLNDTDESKDEDEEKDKHLKRKYTEHNDNIFENDFVTKAKKGDKNDVTEHICDDQEEDPDFFPPGEVSKIYAVAAAANNHENIEDDKKKVEEDAPQQAAPGPNNGPSSYSAVSARDLETRLPLGSAHRVVWNLLVTLLRSKERRHNQIIGWKSFPALQFRIRRPEDLAKIWGSVRGNPTLNWKTMKQTLAFYDKNNLVKKIGKENIFQFTRMPSTLKAALEAER